MILNVRPIILLVGLLAGCSGTPLSVEQQAATNIAVVNATQVAHVTQTAAAATPEAASAATAEVDPARGVLESELDWRCPVNPAVQTMRVGNWFTYIDDTTLPNFERLCAVSIDYQEYGDPSEAAAFVQNTETPFDVMILSDADVALFAQQGLLTPLDHTLLPNAINLTPELLNRAFDPGNRYSYPYLWGTIGAGYNAVTVGETITSWEQVFERPDLRVGWMNSPREIMGIALGFLGLDPNSSNPADLAQARDYLLDHSDNVRLIDDEEGQTLLADGELDIVIEYSGDVFQIIAECACETFVYVVPDEGTPFGLDNLVIPAAASDVALAHAFLNYLMIPRVSANIADYTAYASPNQVAINRGLINPDLLSDPGIYPGETARQNLMNIISTPELDVLYETYWAEVVAALTDN